MSQIKISFFLCLMIIHLTPQAWSQKIELSDDPRTIEVSDTPTEVVEPVKDQPTGKAAAQKFFTKDASDSSSTMIGSQDHYLMFGVGAFVNSKSYKWGPKNPDDDPGEFNATVTYRFGEWVNSMDFMMRLDYQSYDVEASQDPKKISVLPMIIFPDARSGFPVYLGAGLGLGIFMNQPDNESNLSLDYQFVLGGRMLNVFNTVGFFAEIGLKNHVHLLSSGQFDGVFVSFGSVFTF